METEKRAYFFAGPPGSNIEIASQLIHAATGYTDRNGKHREAAAHTDFHFDNETHRLITEVEAFRIAELSCSYYMELGVPLRCYTWFSDFRVISLLDSAKAAGYKITFVYANTSSPKINIRRANIAYFNQPDKQPYVPDDLIREQYKNSLNMLLTAYEISDIVYIYDSTNITEKYPKLVLHKHPVNCCDIKDKIPRWVTTYLIKKASLHVQYRKKSRP
jgi:predicted ABC-type ATPase